VFNRDREALSTLEWPGGVLRSVGVSQFGREKIHDFDFFSVFHLAFAKLMEMCDNVAVSPRGHLFACEDKAGGVNYLRGVTPQGRLYTVGRNAQPGGGDVAATSELAGVCFSPDGSTMFLNVYSPGMTLAITGPWGRFRV